jgi:hypothetical protein
MGLIQSANSRDVKTLDFLFDNHLSAAIQKLDARNYPTTRSV